MSHFRPVLLALVACCLAGCSAGSIDGPPEVKGSAGGTLMHPSSTDDAGAQTTNTTPQPQASLASDAGAKTSCADPTAAGDLSDIPPGADAPATAITEGDILDPQSGAKLALYALSAPKTIAPPTTT